MGGNLGTQTGLGCICLENRHDNMDTVQGNDVVQQYDQESYQHKVNFAHATPRCVQGTALELEKRKHAAQSWLASACNGDDPVVIQKAIIWASNAGVPQAEIDDAAAVLKRLGARHKARDALAQAVEHRDESSLRQAVSLADEAGVDSTDVEQASELLEQLEKDTEDSAEWSPEQKTRRRAMANLQQAMTSRGQRELERAISEAERAGLGTKSERAALAQARVMLKIVTARKEAAQRRRAQDKKQDAGETDDVQSDAFKVNNVRVNVNAEANKMNQVLKVNKLESVQDTDEKSERSVEELTILGKVDEEVMDSTPYDAKTA